MEIIYAKCSPSEPNDKWYIICTVYKNKFRLQSKKLMSSLVKSTDLICSQLFSISTYFSFIFFFIGMIKDKKTGFSWFFELNSISTTSASHHTSSPVPSSFNKCLPLIPTRSAGFKSTIFTWLSLKSWSKEPA